MKALILIAATLLASTSAFANNADLKVFNTLLKVGAQSKSFMSQIHVGLNQIDCAYSVVSRKYDCTMNDISANNGQGATLNLSGKKARAMFNLIAASGAVSDNGMGKLFLTLDSIVCSQAHEGVADGSEADRTTCTITPESEKEDL